MAGNDIEGILNKIQHEKKYLNGPQAQMKIYTTEDLDSKLAELWNGCMQ